MQQLFHRVLWVCDLEAVSRLLRRSGGNRKLGRQWADCGILRIALDLSEVAAVLGEPVETAAEIGLKSTKSGLNPANL